MKITFWKAEQEIYVMSVLRICYDLTKYRHYCKFPYVVSTFFFSSSSEMGVRFRYTVLPPYNVGHGVHKIMHYIWAANYA